MKTKQNDIKSGFQIHELTALIYSVRNALKISSFFLMFIGVFVL